MARKAEDSAGKKECPSCGLGVSLDATVCEFCGWDFEEEDEWISQIEKLERDLMVEKQKFEPGTVEHKIESTLRAPTLEDAETTTELSEPALEEDIPEAPAPAREEPAPGEPEPAQEEVRAPSEPVPSTPAPKVRRVRNARPQPPAGLSARVARVRAAMREKPEVEGEREKKKGFLTGLLSVPSQQDSRPKEEAGEGKKARVLRKVKK